MKKLKWGVIGAGGIARTRTIPGLALAQNAELAAVMDPKPDMAGSLAQTYGGRAYTSAAELMQDPRVEAVYIASPVYAHEEQVLMALAAGLPVLVEKPAGRTVAECLTMQSAARQAGVPVGVGFMMRFHTFHQQIRQLIQSGALGQVVSARAQQIFWYPAMENCWRQEKRLSGGGALMDVGIHNIDLIEYITGSRTRRVTGFTNTRTFSYDVDDMCNLLLQLENGAVAYIDGAFNAHSAPGGNLLEVYGTRGTILVQGSIGQVEQGRALTLSIDAEGRRGSYTLREDFTNLYQKEIEAFSEAVLKGTEPPVTLADGIGVQKVAEAAYQAQAEGRVVAV